jgi:hypothetical protein
VVLADASPATPGEDALSRRHPAPSSQRRLVRSQALLLKAALPSLLAKGLQDCSEGLITDWKFSDQNREKNTWSRTGDFGLTPLQYVIISARCFYCREGIVEDPVHAQHPADELVLKPGRSRVISSG